MEVPGQSNIQRAALGEIQNRDTLRCRQSALPTELPQWRIQGGSLGSAEPPFLSFCAHVSLALCARTSAVENVLDSGTPPFKILDLPLYQRATQQDGAHILERP